LKEEVKAGFIIVISLIILSGFVILIGEGQFLRKFDHYYVSVKNAAGLEIGAQVKLGGVRNGRVIDIKVPEGPGEPIVIEIGIRKGTALYRGTKAHITQIGFVGDIYLLLSIDNTMNEKIKVGDVIPSEESVGFAVLMSRLEGLSISMDGLIQDIDKLFSQKNIKGIETLVGNTNKAIISSSLNIEKVATALKSTTDKLEIVLNEIEELVRDNKSEILQLVRSAKEDLDKAGDMITSIEKTAESLEEAVDMQSLNLDNLLNNMTETTKSVDRAVDIQSQNLDNLLNTMTKTTEDLREVMQEIKNKPWSVLYKEGKNE
jgi:ABC-type transporter Mla subunit MlaD